LGITKELALPYAKNSSGSPDGPNRDRPQLKPDEKTWRKLDLIRSWEEILRQLNGFGRGTKKPSN